jgi:DNA repair photolyase
VVFWTKNPRLTFCIWTILQYNTCAHGCNYCYANTSKITAYRNYEQARGNDSRETILPEG